GQAELAEGAGRVDGHGVFLAVDREEPVELLPALGGIEVGVLLVVRHEEAVPEVGPRHRGRGPEGRRRDEPRVALPPHVDEQVVAVELLSGAGREVVLPDALDRRDLGEGVGERAHGQLPPVVSAMSCQASQFSWSTEPRYSPPSPGCMPYHCRTPGRSAAPQLPW